ncbi:MAG: hypothetical protein KIT11_09855 [Fimbriimonadaceae bacterium]|nr:hypothetical protein [Fimbriimonadaceae bacterium]QYK55628.1 MAG: hypothetical protein KF733_11525 [Fimbriimonadaceae bacterium]
MVIVLGFMFFPFYLKGKKDAEYAECKRHMHEVWNALSLYATQNNDSLPPTHNQLSNGSPAYFGGYPVTWVSQIRPFLNGEDSFRCPSSHKEESSESLYLEDSSRPLHCDFGMYRGLSTAPTNKVPDPNSVVLIAETSNFGAMKSYNPIPFQDEEGQDVTQDGFLIGWDNGNLQFNKQTKRVTRLAFRNTANGSFLDPSVEGRHGKSINAITLSGSLTPLTAGDTEVKPLDYRLTGTWASDPVLMGEASSR